MEPHNRLIRNKLSNYLKGKRVAIVGPASSIIGSGQADLIDSYDVVVRLNKALPIPPELEKDVGTRTDILYNCMNPTEECGGVISINVLNKTGVKFLVGAYPPVDSVGSTKLRIKTDTLMFYHKNRNNWKNFCYTDKTHFLTLWKTMRLPNTGTMAILDLLRFDIKELYITGITFFKGGYIRTYRDYDEKGIMKHLQKFKLHLPEKQLDYARSKLLQDKRVSFDNTLSDILNDRESDLNLINSAEIIKENNNNLQENNQVELDEEEESLIREEDDEEINNIDDDCDDRDNNGDDRDNNGDDRDNNGDERDEEGNNNGDVDDGLIDISVVNSIAKNISKSDTLSDLIVEADESGHEQLDQSIVKQISVPNNKHLEDYDDDFDDNVIGEIKCKLSIFIKK